MLAGNRVDVKTTGGSFALVLKHTMLYSPKCTKHNNMASTLLMQSCRKEF